MIKDDLSKINKHFYNENAQDFSLSRANVWDSFLYIKDKYIKNGDNILDIGCGNGRFAKVLDSSTDYTGVDFSSKLLNIAKHSFPQYKFYLRDVAKEGWYNNIGLFNVIVAIARFHHIPEDKSRNTFFNDVKKILKKNGVFIFSVWNISNIENYKPIKGRKNDYLIPWQNRKSFRYVHKFQNDEVENYISLSPFQLIEKFQFEQNSYFVVS